MISIFYSSHDRLLPTGLAKRERECDGINGTGGAVPCQTQNVGRRKILLSCFGICMSLLTPPLSVPKSTCKEAAADVPVACGRRKFVGQIRPLFPFPCDSLTRVSRKYKLIMQETARNNPGKAKARIMPNPCVCWYSSRL